MNDGIEMSPMRALGFSRCEPLGLLAPCCCPLSARRGRNCLHGVSPRDEIWPLAQFKNDLDGAGAPSEVSSLPQTGK